MNSIFFEKQEGALCAQHALNALLQGSYFTAVDLAAMARTLDAEEREMMRQGGVDNAEYLRVFQQDSFNMDDTGYFSVQVISAALRVWNLRLVPFTANEEPLAVSARADPTFPTAYICNFREHWFTIRKFASQQWFNLNSVLNGPELISPTYLHLFLSQLQTEGYSIFVVDGALPQCQADVDLLLHPPSADTNPGSSRAEREDGDADLKAAIALSLSNHAISAKTISTGTTKDEIGAALAASAKEVDDEDVSLKEAIARSMNEQDDEALQQALLLSMQNGSDGPSTSSAHSSSSCTDATSSARPPPPASDETPNVVDLRAKRVAFLNRLQTEQRNSSTAEETKK